MTTREWLGLLMSITAFTIAPLGYWVSSNWYVVALVLGCPGMALFFTARNSRKYDPSVAPAADVYPGTSELRGFQGSGGIDGFADDADGD